MHLLVVSVIMSHQCLVRNHLELSGPQLQHYCFLTYHELTSDVTDEAPCPADIIWLPTDAHLQQRSGQKSTHTHIPPTYMIMTQVNCALTGFNMTFLS